MVSEREIMSDKISEVPVSTSSQSGYPAAIPADVVSSRIFRESTASFSSGSLSKSSYTSQLSQSSQSSSDLNSLGQRKRSREKTPYGPEVGPARKKSDPKFFLPEESAEDDHPNPVIESRDKESLRQRSSTFDWHRAAELRHLSDNVHRGLLSVGVSLIDNFLGTSLCANVLAETQALYDRDLFSPGELMEQKAGTLTGDVRNDTILWYDNKDPEVSAQTPAIQMLISMVDSVVILLNGRIPPYKISGKSRAMIACYSGNGARYVRHVDNPAQDGRCITSIYYMNPGWESKIDGGCLRIYPEMRPNLDPVNVDPISDRLVFFWSDNRNPHEVMPVYRPRFALTIWFFDEKERAKAIIDAAKKASGSDVKTNEPSYA